MIIVIIIRIVFIILFLCVFTVWLCVACPHLYRIQPRHPFSAATPVAAAHNDGDDGDDFNNDDDFKKYKHCHTIQPDTGQMLSGLSNRPENKIKYVIDLFIWLASSQWLLILRGFCPSL